jgi:hypothetical protein
MSAGNSSLTVFIPKQQSAIQHYPTTVNVKDNEISNNSVNGDLIVAGVQNIFQTRARNPNALLALIERSKTLAEDSVEYRNMLDELQSCVAIWPGRKIIGLEAKLMGGGREDLIEDAIYLEGKFARRLAQGQHSPSTIAMFLHCLSQINSAFAHYIYPLMQQSGVQPVDAAIKLHVIDPIYEELAFVDCSLNIDLVRGMLYFLTGKCHILWR